MTFEQIFYSAIVGVWIAGVIAYFYYFRNFLRTRKKENSEDNKSKRKLGKRCPQCHNIINYQRQVCQHCGYQFPEVPEHPGAKTGRRNKKRRGKKCPRCGNVVNHRREACQHCGFKFGVDQPEQKPEAGEKPGSEPKAAN